MSNTLFIINYIIIKNKLSIYIKVLANLRVFKLFFINFIFIKYLL